MQRCLFCGAAADQDHHPTACLADSDAYLDPDFTIPLCRPCHYAEHDAWRDVGIDEISDPFFARETRLLWLMGRLADLGHSVELSPEIVSGFHGAMLGCRRPNLALGSEAA
jgi:hypothetical protein